MSDRDALLAAIRAQPDEDTPRLMFADWLQENGENERAEFIRTQVELARTPPWEPFAVRCRWRQPAIVSAQRFLSELPRTNQQVVCWSEEPFRRGFGWAIDVRYAGMWTEHAEPLFRCEPIGKVSFWAATLDDWRELASSEWVKQFRDLVFHLNPNEPLLALRDKPAACGITDLRFRRASGAGMPEVLEELFISPLGHAVRGLHFHTGYESTRELIDAINTGRPLERLSFSVMGITSDYMRQLLSGQATTSLEELHLRDERLGGDGLLALAEMIPTGLRVLTLASVESRANGWEALARCEGLTNLRRLNLSRNPFTPRALRVLSLSHALSRLRSLDLSACKIDDKGARHVTRAKFWPNLVELDLRQNPISAAGVKHLLDAPVPTNLTALILSGDTLGVESRSALVKKYGDAVVFVASEVPA